MEITTIIASTMGFLIFLTAQTTTIITSIQLIPRLLVNRRM